MKESTREFILYFSKANKIGREKMEQFSEYILAMEAPAIPEEKETAPRGRKTTDESIRILEQIQAMQSELVGKLFTSKELAEQIGAEPNYVTNNLRWLADNMGESYKLFSRGLRSVEESVDEIVFDSAFWDGDFV